MRNVVEDNYGLAVQLAVEAFMISGAIAIGLVFSEVVNQIIKGRGKHAADRYAGRTDRQ
jgi:uncharacterized membrane protein YjjB (DUF3815 family)